MTRDHRLSRRSALTLGCAALGSAVAPTFVPSSALGDSQNVAASERVTLGHIGVGGRGSLLLRAAQTKPGIQSLAVADCFEQRREKAASDIGGTAYADFRHLLDRRDIDGVIIATPDHWHIPIALLALQAGKDVYIEKPLGLTLKQDLACREAVRRHDRVLQYGTQQREAWHMQFGHDLVRSGKLGRIRAIEVQAPNGGRGGSTEEAPIPAGFDFDMWLGPAPRVPYTVDRCRPSGTYWIYDQSIGYLGGWGAHPLDVLVWCYDGDMAHPYTVEGTGNVPTEGLYDTVIDWNMTLHMADNVEVRFTTGSDSTKFIGTDARLELTRNSIRSYPQDLVPAQFPANNHFENSANHIANLADCIRSRAQPSAPIDDAVRSDVMSHLCDIAVRTGEKITWDPQRCDLIAGSDQARGMFQR